MTTRTRTRPTANCRPKLQPPPTPEEVDARVDEYRERTTRAELRTNAFREMSDTMFGAVEDLIRQDLEDAASHFGPDGRIGDNRLAEVRAHLVRAAGLATALLECGECAR